MRLRRITFLLAAVIFLGHGVQLFAIERMAILKTKYEETLESFVLSHGMKMSDIQRQYETAVETFSKKAQEAGDLDRTTALLAELARFRRKKAVPPETPEDAISDVRQLQNSYRERYEALEEEHAKNVLTLADGYDRALDTVQKDLTRNGKFEDAMKVKNERQRVASSTYVVSARVVLTEQAAKRKQRESETEKPKHKSLQRIRKHPPDAVEFNGHYYKFMFGQYNWNTAKRECERLIGKPHLVTIESQQENRFVNKLVNGLRIWLGATDKRREGHWEWIDGTPFDYTNWDRGQPNNARDGEHFLVMQGRRGQWHDFRENANIQGYVAEWD